MEAEAEFDEVSIVKPEVSALEAISRSEVAMQLDAAHRWPRSITKFLRDATSLATYDEEIAASCMYSIPRGGKMIEGPSVRLAEICASAWGNLHVGSRVIDETDSTVVAQAIVWDLERNVRLTVEAQRGILTSKGKRYDDDMVRVTGMAAVSIALRNAVFRVIPGAYRDQVYAQARATAVGDAQTLTARRDKWLAHLAKTGATPDRIFARLGVVGASDITLEHLATIIGLANAIKNGEVTVDVAFPAVVAVPTPAAGAAPPPAPVASAPEGRRVNVGKRGRPKGTEPPAAEPAPAAEPSPVQQEINASAARARESIARGETNPATGRPVTPVDVLEALATVDPEAWNEAGGDLIVERWTPEQRRLAWVWARAVITDGAMELQANRPAHTFRTDGGGDD